MSSLVGALIAILVGAGLSLGVSTGIVSNLHPDADPQQVQTDKRTVLNYGTR